MRAYLPTGEQEPQKSAPKKQTDLSKLHTGRTEVSANAGESEKQKPSPVHVEKQTGRNDQCPCGSGKKFKQCHGKA